MCATPGSASGPAAGDPPDWVDEVMQQLDRAAEASAGEVRSLAHGIRQVFSGERLENALTSLRARLARRGEVSVAPNADELRLRDQIRAFGAETTIEDWGRYSVRPPSIRL